MGAKRWQTLHKLVYLIAGLGLLHFFWMRAAKNNFAEVFVYAAIIVVLLGWRVMQYLRKKRLQLNKIGRSSYQVDSDSDAYPATRCSWRIWSCELSRCLIRCTAAPSTRISAARPRVL